MERTSKDASRVEVANVLGHRAKTGTVVGDRQVVVHGLGDVDSLNWIAQGLGELRDLVAGVGRVAAAVIEEVADIVGLEDLDEPVVLALVGLQALELVAAGAEAAGGRMAQGGDVCGGLLAGVDQVLGQGADNAVAAGIDVGDLVRMLAGRLNDAAGGGIDYGGDATGLGIKGILRGHDFPSLLLVSL
jgi:hypothetical protein